MERLRHDTEIKILQSLIPSFLLFSSGHDTGYVEWALVVPFVVHSIWSLPMPYPVPIVLGKETGVVVPGKIYASTSKYTILWIPPTQESFLQTGTCTGTCPALSLVLGDSSYPVSVLIHSTWVSDYHSQNNISPVQRTTTHHHWHNSHRELAFQAG